MPVDRRISCRSPEIRAHCAHLRRRHHNVRVRSGLAPAGGNRHGYAGYEFEPVTAYAICHVRYRVLNSDTGVWLQRDPLGTLDGPNCYGYVSADPINNHDALGLVGVGIIVTSVKLAILVTCGSTNCPTTEATYQIWLPRRVRQAGWIVQYVEMRIDTFDCHTRVHRPEVSFKFFEARRVPAGSFGPVATDSSTLFAGEGTPTSTFPGYLKVSTPSFGHGWSTGVIRFYTDAQVTADDPAQWLSGWATPGATPAASEKATTVPPRWWQPGYGPEGHDRHHMQWACCYECGSFVRSQITPPVFMAWDEGGNDTYASQVYWPGGPMEIP